MYSGGGGIKNMVFSGTSYVTEFDNLFPDFVASNIIFHQHSREVR